jgi:hypothetical protein
MSSRRIESPISSMLTSTSIRSGTSNGSASIVISRATCCSAPPSRTPGESPAPTSSMPTVVWIGRSSRTTTKSTWVTRPLIGSRWNSLRIAGRDEPATATSRIAFSPWSPVSARRSSRSAIVIATGSAPPP